MANAGIFSQAPLWEMDEQTWDDVVDVNLKAVWRTMKAVLPHMLPPETIADAALWLASDAAFGVTGQAVVVDSGHLTMPGFDPAPAGP
jgi:NAD(P)-dependent dehydrogenase (short-subunit alcohol dehydrogenase family)